MNKEGVLNIKHVEISNKWTERQDKLKKVRAR